MGKPHTTLGIEIGETSLKLALFDTKLNKVIRLGVVDVASHPLREVDLLEKVILQWAEYAPGLDASAITLSLPARLCVVRQVEIPTGIPNVKEYVEWEFSSATNSPSSEYYLDYQVAETSKKQNAVATVGAIRRIWLDSLRKGFQRKDLIPGVVEVDAFSLLNLVEAGIPEAKTKVSCVVKVDRSGVIVLWGQAGALRTIRWVSVGSLSTMSRIDAFQSLAKDLTDELHQGFSLVGVEDAKGQIVYLCGDLSVEDDFVKALRDSSPDFLYHLLDSFSKILLDSEGASSSKAPLCATAIGAALRFREDRK
jgi:Tfp pilus assembly PilM family ATPase